MTRKKASATAIASVLGRAALLGFLALSASSLNAASPKGRAVKETPFHIELLDARTVTIAKSAKDSSGRQAALTFDREYQPGDHISIAGPSRMAVHLDDTLPECLLYLSDPPHAPFSFEIPYGTGEPQTRSSYAPEMFAGKSHRVAARPLTEQELSSYRNLARNPCDQQLQPPAAEETPAPLRPSVFPHASTNSASRDLPDFRARNAIDGATKNGHHGIWPYQSWGPGLRNDLWWMVDFGRPVEIDKLRLMIRADFPHDSYWQSAALEFSDGTQLPLQITASPEFQDFPFPKHRVSWIRLTRLVPVDPAKWCSLIEVEAWGRDLDSPGN